MPRIHLGDESEFTLAKHILQLDEVLNEVAQDLLPEPALPVFL
jgi:arginyl-tRNA synthetase